MTTLKTAVKQTRSRPNFFYEFLAFIIEILKRYTMFKTCFPAIGSFVV